MIATDSRILHFRALRTTTLWVLLVGVLLPAWASAAPRLRCQLAYAGATKTVEFATVSDPYRVEAVDINGRFRFKAVVVGDEQHIDYVSLYIYYQAKRQAVLLHQAKYRAPVAYPAPVPTALTGENYLYSPDREREFQYGCAVYEVAP